MSSIQIVTDSTSDLTRELITSHGITVIPLHVVFNGVSYKDGIELTTEQLYGKVRELDILPKTAAPSPSDFISVFEPFVREGKQVLYIGLSSKLSSTYQNAVIAAREFPAGAVETVDSLNLSTGIGLLVMKAADYVKQGFELKEVASKLRGDAGRVETEFVIDTLDYLHMGGRCSGTQKLIGSLLRIHPVVKVEDGGMVPTEKLRGKMDKVIQSLLERALAHKDNIDPARIFVTHSMADENARWLKAELKRALDVNEIILTEAGCVISSHCGPGTVGILYLKRTA